MYMIEETRPLAESWRDPRASCGSPGSTSIAALPPACRHGRTLDGILPRSMGAKPGPVGPFSMSTSMSGTATLTSIDRQVRADAEARKNKCPWSRCACCSRSARMRDDEREIAQPQVLTQQGTEKLDQETVCERVRRAEGIDHLHRDVVARAPHLEKPVRRRFRRFGHALHVQIERAELRDVLAMHGLDGSERKRSTQQDAAVLLESGLRRLLGFGEQALRWRSRSAKPQ